MQIRKPLQISFEFFPPKTSEGGELLCHTAHALAKYHPAFFSVTFGAGGGTRTGTIETVKMLQQQNNHVQVAPHLSCIGLNSEELAELLKTYQALNVKQIVALRGDIPPDFKQKGEFQYASDLVAFIRDKTGNHFRIAVAAYPEVHPQAANAKEDVLNLKRKQDAGANSAITQYFFNSDAYFYYLDECTKHGVHLPIMPGIMPITQLNKLVHFSQVCGAEIPRWIRKRLESYDNDIESIQAFGLEVVYDLCQCLLTGGAPGLHFYTLNKAPVTIELLNILGLNASLPEIVHSKKKSA